MRLKETYQSCMGLFPKGFGFEGVSVGGVDYYLEIMPATINSDYMGIMDSGTILCMDMYSFHKMVVLSYLLSDCEAIMKKAGTIADAQRSVWD